MFSSENNFKVKINNRNSAIFNKLNNCNEIENFH